MNKWHQLRLKDVADVKLSNVDKKTNSNEIKISLCNYTDVYKNDFINADKVKDFMIATCNENEFEKFILREGQVAITKDSETRNDIGVSTYIKENLDNVVLGYHLALLTPINSKLNGRFLHYWLNSKQSKKYFENNAGGSGQRCTLTLDIIKSIPLNLPSLSIQKEIALTLSSLEEKIELNNKINIELEAMAKTFYDYWFVQFDFPDKNGKPYKSSGGKMVYNEKLKREIPVGWEVGKLDKFASIAKGDLITNKTSEIGKIKVVAGGLDFAYFHSNPNRKENTITISGSGASAGYVNFWREEIFASDCTTVRGESDLETLIILQFLKQNQNQIYRQSKGSAQPHVYPNDIKSLLYVQPHVDIREKIAPILLPLNKKIGNNIKQNQQLTELRDWLLPMLMNGQVIVNNESDFGKDEVLAMVAEPSAVYEKN